MVNLNQERKEQADQLYERYVKPLEREHRGEYAAVSVDGKILFGKTLLEVFENTTTIPAGSFVFKVGEKVVGRWR